jgi:hypothetical protein
MAKSRFDTSFNFGANVKPKATKGKAGKARKKKPKMGSRSKSRQHFATMHGS